MKETWFTTMKRWRPGILLVLILIIPALLALPGCGIKPNQLKPPADAEDTTFPRTYPTGEK